MHNLKNGHTYFNIREVFLQLNLGKSENTVWVKIPNENSNRSN